MRLVEADPVLSAAWGNQTAKLTFDMRWKREYNQIALLFLLK